MTPGVIAYRGFFAMLNRTQELLADLDRQEIQLLRDRLDEAETGDFVAADMIEEWVGSWFTSGELPPPAPSASGT